MYALSSLLRVMRPLAAAATVALALAFPAHAENATPLVSTGWLKQNLKNPDVFVLDVRSAIDGGGAEAYQKGHIPGAIHSDYDKAGWRVTRGGVPFMLPTLAELEKLIGELGIDEDSACGRRSGRRASSRTSARRRAYWTLKVSGVTKVSILDGGYAAWAAENNEVETGASKPNPKIFTATLNKALFVDAREVEAIEKGGSATLVDARPGHVLQRQGKGAGRTGLWPHPGRGEPRQCDVL